MIKVISSGSSGNSYVIQAGKEKLLLEAGIHWKKILSSIGYSTGGVIGCLISHAHGDHSTSVNALAARGIKIYAPVEVFEKHKINVASQGRESLKTKIVGNKDDFKVGNFSIRAFNCQHTNSDGSDCANLGYLIHHQELGKILFATDTYYLKYKFNNVDHILIECNYSNKYVIGENANDERVVKSHMSLETLKKTLKTWDLSKTKTITLIHLSHNNSNPEEFKEEIEKLTGVPTHIATPGLIIE